MSTCTNLELKEWLQAKLTKGITFLFVNIRKTRASFLGAWNLIQTRAHEKAEYYLDPLLNVTLYNKRKNK